MTFLSDSAEALLGYPKARLLESPILWLDVVAPEDRLRVEFAYRQVARVGGRYEIEYELLGPDHRAVRVRERVGRFEDAGSTCLRGMLVQDESAQAHFRSPRTSRDRLVAILGAVADGVTVQDPTGKLTYANAAAARLIGYPSPEALLDAPLEDVMGRFEVFDEAGQTVPLGHLPGRLALVGEESPAILLRFRVKATGEERYSVVRARPIFDELGRVELAVNAVQDVTELKRAEEALRESEARVRAVLEHAVDGIITIDERGVVQSLNPAAERIFGYPASEVVGLDVALLMPEPYRAEHDGYLERYLVTGERRVIGIGREVEGRRKDGTTFPMDLAVSEVRLGERRLFTGIVRDVTELHNLQEQQRTFLQAVSHDLRNPLTAALAQAQLIQRHAADPDQVRRGAAVLEASARRMNGLIEDLLTAARLGVGQLALAPESVEPAQAVRDLIERLAGGIPAERVRVDAPDGLPAVLADPGALDRVLANLVGNALKYSPDDRPVTVRVRAEPDEVVFAVADRGPGLSAEEVPRLFDPYYRAPSGRRREGLGLGLYIAKGLVEAQGGRIWAESQVGEGSTFCFSIPLAR